jgi:hypothetical protein
LQLADGDQLDIVVTDFARLGFKFDTPQAIVIGQDATLLVQEIGSFPANIRWNLGRSAGGRFLQEVAPELITQALTSYVNLAPFEAGHQPLQNVVCR